MKMLCVSMVAVLALPAVADFTDGRIDIPTYTPGGYEKTPLFYTGRVYQGAQGRIYPYPAQAEQLDQAIAKLEKPISRELHASWKFFAGGSIEEAEAANRREAVELREQKAKALEGLDL